MKTAEDIIRNKGGESYGVSVDDTVQDALEMMRDRKIGSVLVRDGGKLVGIWTERDLLGAVLREGFSPKTARMGDCMVSDLKFVPHTATVYQLMDHCLGLRHRRVLVEKDGEFIGLLTTGDIMKACLREKSEEIRELNQIASWEYYEDWGMVSKPRSGL